MFWGIRYDTWCWHWGHCRFRDNLSPSCVPRKSCKLSCKRCTPRSAMPTSLPDARQHLHARNSPASGAWIRLWPYVAHLSLFPKPSCLAQQKPLGPRYTHHMQSPSTDWTLTFPAGSTSVGEGFRQV